MTALGLHDVVEWLLKKSKAKDREEPSQYALIDLGRLEPGDPVPEAILRAFEWAREQAFDTFPGGYVRGEVVRERDVPRYLKVAITAAGSEALERRLASQNAGDTT